MALPGVADLVEGDGVFHLTELDLDVFSKGVVLLAGVLCVLASLRETLFAWRNS
jgi:hypothetical protein